MEKNTKFKKIQNVLISVVVVLFAVLLVVSLTIHKRASNEEESTGNVTIVEEISDEESQSRV